jgi:lysophospholipase L1-like esterase
MIPPSNGHPLQLANITRPWRGDLAALLLGTVVFLVCGESFGAEPAVSKIPWIVKGDVIAVIGGEDMVAAGDHGFIEYHLTKGLPEHRLRFRNLGWEGDTVYEQRRELNFPGLPEQLEKIGATVIIAQFGQVESLAGTSALGGFVAAYEKLLDQLTAGGKRRAVLLSPTEFSVQPEPGKESPAVSALPPELREKNDNVRAFAAAVAELAKKRGCVFVDLLDLGTQQGGMLRDGMHLSTKGQQALADRVAASLGVKPAPAATDDSGGEKLAGLIREKNRLWFNYWRPQNWAFLAGDRTNQPSSRDHIDQTKRWFPHELQEFVPLIEAREQEIWAAASSLK